MRYGTAVFTAFLVISAGLHLASPEPAGSQTQIGIFAPGERLQYKVKWLFFRLGTIVVTTERLPDTVGKYLATIILDSNPDLFFISIHNRYEAVVNVEPVRCDLLRAMEVDGSDTLVTGYVFVDSLKRIYMHQRLLPADSLIRTEVRDIVNRFFDGASLFFFARTMIHHDSTIAVPTLVEFDMFQTHMTFTRIPVLASIGALDDPIETLEVSGRAEFEGKTFGGFSGDFKGWFSNDHAAVPIRAEMSITLGTVDVELEQWSRPGWTPPIINEDQ